MIEVFILIFFFSSRRRHTIWNCDWSSDVCSSDLLDANVASARICGVEGHPARGPHVDSGRREDPPGADAPHEPLVEFDSLRDAAGTHDIADPKRERRVPDRLR